MRGQCGGEFLGSFMPLATGSCFLVAIRPAGFLLCGCATVYTTQLHVLSLLIKGQVATWQVLAQVLLHL